MIDGPVLTLIVLSVVEIIVSRKSYRSSRKDYDLIRRGFIKKAKIKQGRKSFIFNKETFPPHIENPLDI